MSNGRKYLETIKLGVVVEVMKTANIKNRQIYMDADCISDICVWVKGHQWHRKGKFKL